ncbi:MAG: hypothetical protein ACLPYS_12305 [Vulcanimicrobiaceae bacterium]
MGTPASAAALRDFCRAQGVNEIYVSGFDLLNRSMERALSGLIAELHAANIRVEALFSSVNADEPGKPREKLVDSVRAVIAFNFNRDFPEERIDGVHLDIEPQQRPENRGAGNLRFLPGLVQTYRAVRELADPVKLSVNADIQRKLLEGDASQREMLLSALPQVTLMLYGLSDAGDGMSDDDRARNLRAASKRFLRMAYRDLPDKGLASMVVGLRTLDYGASLPAMLETLDEANRANPHYAGWARHSYNDT